MKGLASSMKMNPASILQAGDKIIKMFAKPTPSLFTHSE